MKQYILIALAILTALAIGCAKTETSAPEPETVEVTTARVEVRDVPDTVEAVGTVAAKREAVLSAQVMGVIKEILVAEGERVTKGQALVMIDSAEILARKREAESARAEGEAAMSEAESAKAEANAALANVKVNAGRFRNLYAEQAVTKKELDDVETQAKMAEAKLGQVDAKIRQVKARIAQADAAIAQADVMLGHTVIRAPFGGVVSGKTASAGEMAAPGRPIMKLNDDRELQLVTGVKEGDVSGIGRGTPVEVATDSLDGALGGGGRLKARVYEIVPAADPMTRSFTVKLELPGTKGLMPGMFGRAYLPAGTRKAVLLPDAALVDREGMQGAFVVREDGTLAFQAVRLGGGSGGMREVLSGLSGGEKVVVGDLSRLRQGMKAAR
ncbi:MAG: efflux RND transporter periplasmic adaptor subunit [Nitrospirae bacterium]|nr:efflux RND transporter periplasmic adaptor subunit [Nitrospirota bacterium]